MNGNLVQYQEPSLATMMQSLIDKGLTIENASAFEKFCDLYQRFEDKRAEREFNAAFAKLQKDMPQVEATKPVPNNDGTVRYRYAPFEDILEKVQPFLTDNGFSVSFNTKFEEGRLSAVCILRHVSGHSQSNEFAVRIGKGPPGCTETQADGAAKTYAKRGALSDALNIVVDKDDDARLIGQPITPDEADELRQRVRELVAQKRVVNEEAFLKFAGAAHYEAIPEDRLDRLNELLDRKERGQMKRQEEPQGEYDW